MVARFAKVTLKITRRDEVYLVLLMSLVDVGNESSAAAIVANIQDRNYWRGTWPNFSTELRQACVERGYVAWNGSDFTITQAGMSHLQDLCELAYASRNQLKHVTSLGFLCIKELRQKFDTVPFTNRSIRRPDNTRDPSRNFHVYVVLLKSEVVDEHHWIVDVNPQRRTNRPCVYVGMTHLTPEERFQNHKRGYKASKYVREFGIRLMPDLYAHLKGMSYEEAQLAERRLAEWLRRQGYTVLAGHHDWPKLKLRGK